MSANSGRRVRAAPPLGPPHPGPFGEALAAVEASSFVWDPDDVLAEAHGNEMWFMHRPPDATAEQVVELLLEVARLRGAHRAEVGAPSGAIVFYAWHDEQAGHLRASSVSAIHGTLPFRRPVPAEALAIARAWVTDSGGLISWDDLEDADGEDPAFEIPELPIWSMHI